MGSTLFHDPPRADVISACAYACMVAAGETPNLGACVA